MPLTDAEERQKLAWEIALMDTQIDRGRIDIEKIRLDIDKTRLDIDKTRADLALDQKRFWVQVWGVMATAVAAIAGAFAAGATWWNYIHH